MTKTTHNQNVAYALQADEIIFSANGSDIPSALWTTWGNEEVDN